MAELRDWLEAAGVSGRKLERALAVCDAKDLEEVADLRELHVAGKLGNQGFADIVLGKIEAALGGGRPSPPPPLTAFPADPAECRQLAQSRADEWQADRWVLQAELGRGGSSACSPSRSGE